MAERLVQANTHRQKRPAYTVWLILAKLHLYPVREDPHNAKTESGNVTLQYKP
jgi:hypothetical protein